MTNENDEVLRLKATIESQRDEISLLEEEIKRFKKIADCATADASEKASSDIRHLNTEIEILKSTISIRDVQIKELTEVVARNLTRVKAETAVAAASIAAATMPRQREQQIG